MNTRLRVQSPLERYRGCGASTSVAEQPLKHWLLLPPAGFW